MQHTVFIGVGSNVGDRQANCHKALTYLTDHKDIKVAAVSNLYETKALTIDDGPQRSYINGAAKILTDLEPLPLLNILKDIENKMGRTQDHRRWAPRPIDLDILFYDDLVFSHKDLAIPHPEAEKRRFVLQPLCDIEPGLIHPIRNQTVSELYKELI